MDNNPRPDDDERWTVEEDTEESTEELSEKEEDNSRFNLSRRQTLGGIGAIVLGTGGLAATTYNWEGGNAPNTNTTPGNPATPEDINIGPGAGNLPEPDIPGTDTEEPTEPPTDDPTETPPPTETPETSEDGIYELEGEVTVNLDSLTPIFEHSSIDIGIQENGNLVAWNEEVEIQEGDSTYNPLYRFQSTDFPDRDFYEIEGSHPIQQLYNNLETTVEEMSERMVKVFYDEEDDDGTWEDHQEYRPVDFEELKEGLIEYSNIGAAQDYFFNRQETLRTGEGELEQEWEELVKDGLEATDQ